MNQNKAIEYSKEFPDELKLILKGASTDTRLGIIIALLKNGKMTFNEMKNNFQINSSGLVNQLTILQNGNLIKNFYEKKKGKIFSYYDVTDIPELLFNSLFDILSKIQVPMTIKPKKTKPISELISKPGTRDYDLDKLSTIIDSLALWKENSLSESKVSLDRFNTRQFKTKRK